MALFEKYLTEQCGISPDAVAVITSAFQPEQLKKGDYYLKAGRMGDRLGFLQDGLLRVYASANDKEVTQWISTAGYFITDVSSFVFEQPARWNIEALTDCKLYSIHKKEYEQLGRLVPEWHAFDKQFIARCFSLLEDRIFSHLHMSAAERFHSLFNKHPEMFNIVPLQYLASMLGMTPETLSRLRKSSS